MDTRVLKLLKTLVWKRLEFYLQHPGCDLGGDVLGIHCQGEDHFVRNGSYDTAELNPEFVERLNFTNVFSQVRDEGTISESDYYFIKKYCERGATYLERKLGVPAQRSDSRYNTLMHIVTAAMACKLYPRLLNLVEQSQSLERAKQREAKVEALV